VETLQKPDRSSATKPGHIICYGQFYSLGLADDGKNAKEGQRLAYPSTVGGGRADKINAEQAGAVKLSIIIPNYNYGEYLGAAIDSALTVDWPDKEVIVADDGSTDNSRGVILSYGGRIIPLFLSNGGQSSACNAAFERCSGDIIIFLDSDDVVFPSVADTLRSAWSDRVSKLQWSLVLTDETLRPLGRCNPAYPTEPTPEWVRQTLARTGNYPYSLAGAWAKSFLCQVFPVPVREGINQGGANGDYRLPVIDRYLSVLAPFFGDVVCISHHQPQGAYRMHGNNGHISTESFEHYADVGMEPFECARYVNSLLSRLNIAHRPINVVHNEDAMKRQLVCQRLKLTPCHCSTLFEALWKYWRSVGLSDAPVNSKLKWLIWGLLVAAGPRLVSSWAVRSRERRSVFAKATWAMGEGWGYDEVLQSWVGRSRES
jgi:hypothetical protein